MKQLFLTLVTVLITASAWAQSPFQFNFQAVARNLAGNPLTNQSVDFRLSVLQGAMDGTAVYVEEQPATTNNFGLANLLVGNGTPALGSLSAVDWANGPYFLQIELDIQNGEGYQLMGTSALASVPYALHAKTSEQAGPEGPQGEPGEQGPAGEQGEAGAGVSQVEIINDSLWLTLTTGEIQNAGRVVPALDSLLSSIGVLSSGSGCNPRFPEGYGTFIHHTILTTDPGYTVPDGYNLYVIGGGADGYTIDQQDYLTQGASWGAPTNPLIVPSGALYREDIIGTTIDVSFRGWLVPVSSEVEVVYIYLDATDPNEDSEFVVPNGKEFVLLRAYAWDGTYEIDGVTWDLDGTTSDWYLNFPSGSRIFDPGVGYVYGYLVNEGYFENCSGSSVGTSTGQDAQLTEGGYLFEDSNTDFTVPAGVSVLFLEVWGAGGGGTVWNSFCQASASGGAGGYARAALQVSPGDVISVEIGSGGPYGSGQDGGATVILKNGVAALEAFGGTGGLCGNPGNGGTATFYITDVNGIIRTGESGSVCQQCNAPATAAFAGTLGGGYGNGNCSGCGQQGNDGFVFIQY